MKNKYSEKIKFSSDASLISMVTAFRDDYETEAILEAEQELKERKISEELWKELETQAEHDRQVQQTNANIPLDGTVKALTLIFPIFISLILSRYYVNQGFKRKGDELATWTFWGFIMYIGLGIFVGTLAIISTI
jgi:hypothetical protein